MTDLLELSASEQADLIARRQLSPVELMEATLARIDERNPQLNAVVTLNAEEALTAARRATQTMPATPPALFGLPFTVKDTIEVAGVRATAGSNLLAEFVPETTSPVVARVQGEGAILVGKSNCPEFGAGNSDTWNDLFGQTYNPRNATRSPGGSSGGDAAAVAAGMASFGVGTDYGGSIRVPAHCVGVAGWRPSPGRLSFAGVLPFAFASEVGGPVSAVARELTSIGFLARSVSDLQRLLRASDPRGRVGQLPERVAWFEANADLETIAVLESVADALRSTGMLVERIEPPGFLRAANLMAELREAEGSPEVAAFSAGRNDRLTPIWRAELAAQRSPARADLPLDVARARSEFNDFMQSWPILMLPVAAAPAFDAAQGPPPPRPGFEDACRSVTFLRLASLSIPCGTSLDGMPIGIQLAGREGGDEDVLAVGAQVERHFGRWKQPAVAS